MSTIIRKRGDNYPIEALIQVNGVALDITGMTVTFSFKPSDGSGVVTSLVGVPEGTTVGLVHFNPTEAQMSAAGQYVYDVQVESGGIKTTHLSGSMLLQGDVTV